MPYAAIFRICVFAALLRMNIEHHQNIKQKEDDMSEKKIVRFPEKDKYSGKVVRRTKAGGVGPPAQSSQRGKLYELSAYRPGSDFSKSKVSRIHVIRRKLM